MLIFVSSVDKLTLHNLRTCGLLTVHGAFKSWMKQTGRDIVYFLNVLLNVLKGVLSRRADFTCTSGYTNARFLVNAAFNM